MIFPLGFDRYFIRNFADEWSVSRQEQYSSKCFTYEGEWKMGKFDGHGKWVFLSGTSYEGEMMENTKRVFGKCTYANGDVFAGELKGGDPDG